MENEVIVNNHRFRRHILLEITKGCNLRCLHCFTSAGKKLDKELTSNEWVLLLNDLIPHGFDAFTISGGEPLIELDKIISILNSIKKTSPTVKFYLFTNGLLLTNKVINLIKPNIAGVGISVDGNKETHDWIRGQTNSYDKAITALSKLKKNRVPTFIQSMVTPQTLPYLKDVLDVAQKYSVLALRFSHMDFFGRGKEHIGCMGLDQKGLTHLYRVIKRFRKEFPSVRISSNIVRRKDIINNPSEFKIPNLHILASGEVLPWEGFPSKYSLWKYPDTNLKTLSSDSFNLQLDKFETIMNKAIKNSSSSSTNMLGFDNIISDILE